MSYFVITSFVTCDSVPVVIFTKYVPCGDWLRSNFYSDSPLHSRLATTVPLASVITACIEGYFALSTTMLKIPLAGFGKIINPFDPYSGTDAVSCP